MAGRDLRVRNPKFSSGTDFFSYRERTWAPITWLSELRARCRLGHCDLTAYLLCHPPGCPGAPPVERGEGPNSGPDWRESVGLKILLPLRAVELGSDGVRVARPGR